MAHLVVFEGIVRHNRFRGFSNTASSSITWNGEAAAAGSASLRLLFAWPNDNLTGSSPTWSGEAGSRRPSPVIAGVFW